MNLGNPIPPNKSPQLPTNPGAKIDLRSLFSSTDVKGALFDPNKVKRNKQRRYFHLMRGLNILSHSTSEKLTSCERKFSCSKLQLNNDFASEQVWTPEGNIDFAFGRAIETGVQAALLNHSRERIFFDMFMAWDINLYAQHPRNYDKTFAHATLAIDQFLYIREQLMQGWEIAMFNGKPAIELAMLLDLENGYYYVGHADVILFHPIHRRYRVLEIKTTGAKNIHESMYKNSNQATGYSVFLDNIAKDMELTSTFEVFYLVFPTSLGYWKLFDFVKSRSSRAAWVNTILLDIQRVDTYKRVDFWPKRGSSCFEYYKPCEFFESCDLPKESFNAKGDYAMIGEEELAEHEFDFRFKLSDILQTQKELLA